MIAPNDYYLDCQPIFDVQISNDKDGNPGIFTLDMNEYVQGAIPDNLNSSYDIKQCKRPNGVSYADYGYTIDEFNDFITNASIDKDKIRKNNDFNKRRFKHLSPIKIAFISFIFLIIIALVIYGHTGGGDIVVQISLAVVLVGFITFLLYFYFRSRINLRNIINYQPESNVPGSPSSSSHKTPNKTLNKHSIKHSVKKPKKKKKVKHRKKK